MVLIYCQFSASKHLNFLTIIDLFIKKITIIQISSTIVNCYFDIDFVILQKLSTFNEA